MVPGTIAARIQSQAMAHGVEEDALQQPEIEDQVRMDAEGIHFGGNAAIHRSLQTGWTICLKSPLWDAARLLIPTLCRYNGYKDVKSLQSVTVNRSWPGSSTSVLRSSNILQILGNFWKRLALTLFTSQLQRKVISMLQDSVWSTAVMFTSRNLSHFTPSRPGA